MNRSNTSSASGQSSQRKSSKSTGRGGAYYGDIADLVADTAGQRLQRELHQSRKINSRIKEKAFARSGNTGDVTILTGGFPCQPFSAAGRRRGTSDDRYKWPEMFEVIRNTAPEWVIAENVAGLVSWSEGLVLEQVCSDLEDEGYEVWPLVIPAVAVNAPHRRDRIWIIAHANGGERNRTERRSSPEEVGQTAGDGQGNDTAGQLAGTDERLSENGESNGYDGFTANSRRQHGRSGIKRGVRSEQSESGATNSQYPDWQRSWQEVAFATCDDGVDDGLSRNVGGFSYTKAKWRKEALKAYGNAIVPEVAMEIFRAIKEARL